MVNGDWGWVIDALRSIPIYLFPILFLCGCKSHKEILSDKTLATDSLSHSEHHRTMAMMDSLMEHIDFSFDSLKINIAEPVTSSNDSVFTPTFFRWYSLSAYGGRLVDNSALYKQRIECYNSLDTVRYKQSAIEHSQQSATSTSLYSPKSITAISFVFIIIFGILLLHRKSKK